jgi:PAS domain S-box-containing protein
MKERTKYESLEKLMQYALDVICILDKEGRFAEINSACLSLLGYEEQELIGTSFLSLVEAKDQYRTRLFFQALIEGSNINQLENCFLAKSGAWVPLSWRIVWAEEEETFFCVGRGGTALSDIGQKFKIGEALHHALMEHGADMLAMLDEKGFYVYVSGSRHANLGYEPSELLGRSAFDFMHPEDIIKLKSFWSGLEAQRILQVPEYRFLAASGEWCWLETIASNQLHNPEIRAVVVSSRDVTEQKKSQQTLVESQQRFKSLFDDNPDMIIYENREGKILDVNRTVETTYGFNRQSLINRNLAEVFPAAVLPQDYHKQQGSVLESPISFEIETKVNEMGKRIFCVNKIPVVVEKQVVGVFTVAKDITAIKQSYAIIKQQARKLNTIFDSLTDAFFTLDRQWHFTYINAEFDRLLETNRRDNLGKNIWDVFPEEVNGTFYRHYKEAMDKGITARFEAHFARAGTWFKVKAFPSAEGLSVYFSDITKRVLAQEESKKLSVVASKTHTGVIIADKDGIVEWVNESFKQITELTEEEQHGKSLAVLLAGAAGMPESTRHAINQLVSSNLFETEVPYTTKSGRELWLKIGVTPILGDDGSISRYVVMISDTSIQKQAILERNQFIEEIQSRNQSLQQFTHLVSHKLRAPVANILGLVSVFDLPAMDDSTKDDVIRKLGNAANNLDSIIKDLNHILSIQDPLGLDKSHILFAEAMDEVLQLLQEQISTAGVVIRQHFNDAPGVFAVKHYLLNILYHLLSNAIKHRSSQKATLIEITTSSASDFITLVVQDNGTGFDLAKHKNNVFGLYKRFHSHVEGKGMGLYLVKAQAEAMGGSVGVASEVGKGSVFKVYFKKI